MEHIKVMGVDNTGKPTEINAVLSSDKSYAIGCFVRHPGARRDDKRKIVGSFTEYTASRKEGSNSLSRINHRITVQLLVAVGGEYKFITSWDVAHMSFTNAEHTFERDVLSHDGNFYQMSGELNQYTPTDGSKPKAQFINHKMNDEMKKLFWAEINQAIIDWDDAVIKAHESGDKEALKLALRSGQQQLARASTIALSNYDGVLFEYTKTPRAPQKAATTAPMGMNATELFNGQELPM